MQLIGVAVDAGTNSFKQIVANGSGLGVAAVGVNPREDGTHDVFLYDVSDPAVPTAFVTQFARDRRSDADGRPISCLTLV